MNELRAHKHIGGIQKRLEIKQITEYKPNNRGTRKEYCTVISFAVCGPYATFICDWSKLPHNETYTVTL